MSTATSRWDEIAALPEGELKEISYPMLLVAMARSGRTGVVEMHRRPVEKRIFFEQGSPVDCRSNLVHETFGRFLVGAGKLSEEAFRATLADSAARDLPLGEVLLERELLDAAELYKLLQQCLAKKLLDGFTWREGTFHNAEDSGEAHPSPLKVRVPQLILTGVLKLTPMDEVTRGIRPLFTEPLAVNPSPPVGEDEVQLRGPAADLMGAFGGKPLRMDELAMRLPQLPGNDLGRVIYALSLLELVVPASRIATVRAAPVSVAPKPDETLMTRPLERPTTVPAPVADADLDKAKNRVLQAYLSYRRKDACELLEVAETASLAEVEDAFVRFAQRHAPWPLEGPAPADVVEKARSVFLAGADAYGELRDPERRNQLLIRRRLQREQKAKAQQLQPSAQRIQTDLLDPEAQFKKGMEMLAAGQDKKALELLQYAADLDAQNAVYRAEAAWCRYRVTASRDRSLEDLDEAVRADPRCGLAYYYMGLIQGQEGRIGEAEESLRRAIKLMSPDRRPIDALKDLTTAKKR
jgi:tetratricopeptide (TPR) repeat protein